MNWDDTARHAWHQNHPQQQVVEARDAPEGVVAHLVRVEWSSSHLYLSTLKGFDLAALNAGKEDAVMITAANSNTHDSQRNDSEFPISRLYGHVREFSPAREEEVIVMQQVTEIYGRYI